INVVEVDDAQRVDQFLAEECATPSVIGERRQGRDDRKIAGHPAEIRLDAPERNNESRLHAVASTDLGKKLAIFGEMLAGGRAALRVATPTEIAREGPRLSGSFGRELDAPPERREPVKGAMDGGGIDAGGKRLRANAAEPTSEILIGPP